MPTPVQAHAEGDPHLRAKNQLNSAMNRILLCGLDRACSKLQSQQKKGVQQ